ncbi:EscU/YscU/HrcU family type III secretion system export apparatus switch protein [Pseudoroseicyclus aestuarii]|uniref:Flagellar biosynthetic protein FlhB n=1 Tax=Pseudoroseicyclus aestuarii TaxID=1795041 RepID=A0A318ST45_9RHOB|nr:flagellar type III secretion system protein FlhB [Pseudoroseicyclus aestuarii]PYE84505.1 flagellar biosynthetic protein FlhB [Pseudoroseicyclus aestuarii]
MAQQEEDQQSKTEEPTDKRLRDARKKGDVPSSREVGTAACVLALALCTALVLPRMAPGLVAALSGPLANAGQLSVATGGAGLEDVAGISAGLVLQAALVCAPLFLALILAALAAVALQGEVVVAAERIKPKWSKLSPAQGLKRLFSAETLVEFLKSLAKVAIIGAVATWVTRRVVLGMAEGALFVPQALPGHIGRALAAMLLGATVLLVPLALADVLWKRAQWMKKQRMSLREIRVEHKESEGDPMLKARRRDIGRARARRRITQAVPTASVILTNPTHYAVALRYEVGRDAAPVCVAKGTDRMAAQIRALARENAVPVIENRPLARALHAAVEEGEVVPAEHWQAVAEIIGYVMDLKARRDRRPPPGSDLRLD